MEKFTSPVRLRLLMGETNNWFGSGERYFYSCVTRFLLLVYVFPKFRYRLYTPARLRLSIYVALRSGEKMFTLAIFSCFQHSENIYAPALGSFISMPVSIFISQRRVMN